MIEVIYYKDSHLLTMDGHSGYSEAGTDIVCSAASILAYTLAEAVSNLNEPYIDLDIGCAEISCNQNDDTANLIFDTICAGYKLLADNYPENISFLVVQG